MGMSTQHAQRPHPMMELGPPLPAYVGMLAVNLDMRVDLHRAAVAVDHGQLGLRVRGQSAERLVLFLVVCLLNTIGLLLAKIMRRSGDISLRRALGATRRAIFAQYIFEAGLIGLAGGVLGIGMTWLGLQGIKGLYGEFDFISKLVTMDWVMIFTAVGLAVLSTLGAAVYPTWRACSIQPASELKAL